MALRTRGPGLLDRIPGRSSVKMRETSLIEPPAQGDGAESAATVPRGGRGRLLKWFAALFLVFRLLGCIASRSGALAQRALAQQTERHGGTVCGGDSRDADQRRFRTGAAREHSVLRGVSDLRANQRLLDEMVQGHRQPRDKRRFAGGNRHAGSGPATRSGARRSGDGAGQSKTGRRRRRSATRICSRARPSRSRTWTSTTAITPPSRRCCSRPRPT